LPPSGGFSWNTGHPPTISPSAESDVLQRLQPDPVDAPCKGPNYKYSKKILPTILCRQALKEVTMNGASKGIVYFNQAGVDNTDDLAEIVYKRLKEGDIGSVVVASTSGRTGLKFARRMARETHLVVVSSHPGSSAPGVWNFNPRALEELQSLGVTVVKQSHILSGLERSISQKFSGASHSEVIAETLRSLFGVGLKVAVECAIMAADSGAIPIGKTISVGGTSSERGMGADCAIVVWPSHCNNFFDFRVLEILAKPLRRDNPTELG
jgi:uncharacterized protein